MKKRMQMVAVALIAAGVVTCASASEWYIDNQATGAHTGMNWADAYTNFAVAVSNVWGAGANTGATIYVRQATGAPDYVGGVEIADGFADGTPEAYNRIVGWTGEGYAVRPVIRLYVTGTSAAPQSHIRLGTPSLVARNCYEFRGLRFYGASYSYCNAVMLCHQTSNVRFVDNSCYQAGVSIDDGLNTDTIQRTNVLVQANTLEAGSNIRLRRAAHVDILDNTISTAGSGIVGNIHNENVRIIGNIVNATDCIAWQNGYNIVIERNRFKATYRAAIWVDWNPAGPLVVRNNIFHEIKGSHAVFRPYGCGIYIGHGTSARPDLVVANNTFYNFPQTGATAIYLNQYIDKASVFNNLIVGVSTGLTFEAGCASTNDYNAFWQVEVPYVGDGTAGVHDRAADPRFKNAVALDFRLGNDTLKFSAAKAFNGVVAPTNDFYGTARGTVLSFGAIASPPGGTQLILR